MKKKLRRILALVTAACIAFSVPVHADWSPGLTREDFRITNTNMNVLGQYDGDTIDALTSIYGDTADFYFYNQNSGGNAAPICRNISIGTSTRQDLIDQFGYALYYNFDQTDDIWARKLYAQEDAAIMTSIFPTLSSEMAYNYKDLYQMVFYLDQNDVVQLMYIFNYIIYKPGSEAIKNAQTLLNTFGYDCGTPDGKIGKNTTNAILNYQNAKGLYASGTVDSDLMNALYEDMSTRGVNIDLFVQRYNEAIDVFNISPEANGCTSVHISYDTLMNGTFAPTNNLRMCVNSGLNNFSSIISMNAWVEDPNALNGTTAAGELMALIYAFDPSIPDCDTALQLFGYIRDQSPVEYDDILFENVSDNGNAAIQGRYFW